MSSADHLTTVSFVMPVLNEENHLAAAVKSIFEQKGFNIGKSEVILALGPSTDLTNLVAEKLKASYPVKLVENPSGKTPSGLNAAIQAASNQVIIRVDAHSQLSPSYAELALSILNETGAANVGGVMRAVGETPFQRAVAWCYASRFGLGGGTFHVGGQAGPTDSVYLGVFRRSILDELNGYNEKMVRGQDWELNLRIREAGHIVWFDPRLEVTYKPRSNLRALTKQFFDTGLWRAILNKRHPNKANLRYFAPPVLVLSTILGLLASIVGVTDYLGFLPISIYLLAVFLLAVSNKQSFATKMNIIVALPAMHFSWGLGFITGLFHKR